MKQHTQKTLRRLLLNIKSSLVYLRILSFIFLCCRRAFCIRCCAWLAIATFGCMRSNIFKKFHTIKLTYFNFFLFLLIALTIIFCKILNIKFIKTVESSPNSFINNALFHIFAIEKKMLNILNLPFGISILGLFKKND